MLFLLKFFNQPEMAERQAPLNDLTKPLTAEEVNLLISESLANNGEMRAEDLTVISDENITTMRKQLAGLIASAEEKEETLDIDNRRKEVRAGILDASEYGRGEGYHEAWTESFNIRNLDRQLEWEQEARFNAQDEAESRRRNENFDKWSEITEQHLLSTEELRVVTFGDKYEEPTRKSWGVMQVDLNDLIGNIVLYVKRFSRKAEEVRSALEKEMETLEQELNANEKEQGFCILIPMFKFTGYDLDQYGKGVTPDDVIKRAEEIHGALVQKGNLHEVYPNLVPTYPYAIDLALDGYDARASLYSGNSVTVNVNDPLETNLFIIDKVASKGNPREVFATVLSDRTGLEDEPEDPNKVKRTNRMTKEYIVAKACGDKNVPVEIGDKFIPPSAENHGKMTIDVNASDKDVQEFVETHIEWADTLFRTHATHAVNAQFDVRGQDRSE